MPIPQLRDDSSTDTMRASSFLAVATLCLGTALADNGFAGSCSNINLQTFSDGAALCADCGISGGGNSHDECLNLNECIVNANGAMLAQPKYATSLHSSLL
jgi:hypothetical protein